MAEERKEYNIQPPRRPRGGPGAMIGGEKPKNFKKAVSGIISYIGKYKFPIIIVMIIAVLSTAFSVMGPKVMGLATTELAEGLMRKIRGIGVIDFDKIARILLFTLGIYGVSSLLTFTQGLIMTGITQKIVYKLRREISEKINRLPVKYFEERQYGDVLSRITNDVDTMGQGLNQSVTMLITSVSTIVGTVIMMLTISPLMTLIAFLIVPVSAFIMSRIIGVSQKHFSKQQKSLGTINGHIEETYSGQQVIKAFNKEDDVMAEFDKINDELYGSALKSQFLSGLMPPVTRVVANLGYIGVALTGSSLAVKGIIGIGDIQAFIQYVRNMSQPLQQIAQVVNQMQSMAAASERVFEFLDEKEEEEIMDLIKKTDVEGAVRFDHVKFGYNPDKIVIKDFSCDVKPGQKIAIVGHTGAGKTTIVKLLMRFYDVNDGAILLDGTDIKRIERHALRDNIGMVLQDTWLFKGSIRENIRYGRLEATDEEVENAAKAAYADNFIKMLPGGYDMELNEDATNVSQGQKQLLTIARAILADNKILILDEATSSVDTRTEERIQKAMDNLMKGRTSFVIAHRLSTIKNSDLILVMEEGDIVEQGSHEELLLKGGIYADMYNSQFEDVA